VVVRFFLLVLCLAAPKAAAQEPPPEVGKKAAMFRLLAYNPAAAGQWVGLEKYVGEAPADKASKLLLLSFMASFCAPCKKELPELQRLHLKYQADGLRVVLVSIDDQPEGMKIIDGLIAEHNVTFPVLKDRTTLAARRWLGKETALPSVFLIKADGVVSLVKRGYDEETGKALEKEVRAQLGKAP
jgi:thiol-disulfide isomerase/thioredoxin